MLRLGSCLGRQQSKDKVIEEEPTKKYDQRVDQLRNQSRSFEASPHIQASSSIQRFESEDPDYPYYTDDLVKPRTQVIDEIVQHFKKEEVLKMILHGKEGVGKTWIAKEVSKQCILKHIIDVTIWVYLNGPELILSKEYKNLCYQLSLQEELDGGEYYLNKEDADVTFFSLKEKLKGKTCLLVLDDANSESRVEKVLNMLKEIIDPSRKNSTKILITRLEGEQAIDDHMIVGDSNGGVVVVEIKPLTLSESKDLLQRSWIENHDVVREDDVEEIVKQFGYLPGAIVFVGNVLGYALKNETSEMNRKLAIREAKKQKGDCYWELGYDKFINNVVILRCFWLSRVFLEERGSIQYNELILYWILEGYFDEKTSLEQLYANAHNVLMDLLDAGVLGEREAGYVVIERVGLNLAIHLFPLLCDEKMTHLDLPYTKSFQHVRSGANVKRSKGRIFAFMRKNFKGVGIETLLVRGDSKSKEQDSFKFSMENDPRHEYYYSLSRTLKIMCISHVNLHLSLVGMSTFKVLILRNCYLTTIQTLNICKDLRVIDISKCEMLDEIPDHFLAYHNSLESLNLSDIPIKSILRREIVSGLSKLRHLFLRGALLETFPDLTGLEELEVLDLSGAKFDSFKTKVWNLQLPRLKILDLSQTSIYEFPALIKLENLIYLSLKNCPLLNKLRPLTTLTKLQVIDASGCNNLHFFREINLPSGNCLRKLDLSKTRVRKLPPLKNAINLIYLCLNGCHQLKELPAIEGAKNLRLIDLSDAIQLEKINTSFHEMESLRELFLSNTKITKLPPFSGLESLRMLILRGCESLKSLPENVGLLRNLSIIDVRSCYALETFFDEQFSHVTILKDDQVY